MATDILLTVLMSVYNEENNIDEAIQSILMQTYDNFEFIIIDDASTDSTAKKIMEYTDKRIVLLRNKTNLGITKNLNRGLDIAKGKYILRMDGDDVSLNTRFAEQVQFMESHPQIVLSGTWIKYIGDSHNLVRYKTKSNELKALILFNSPIAHPTFILRKDVLDQNRIRYEEKLRYAQDYDLIYKISTYGELANIPKAFLEYRIHDKQISRKKIVEQSRCANATRRKILSDLGIELTEEELIYWSWFCLEDKHAISELEKKTVERLIEEILEKNLAERLFDQNIIERYLRIKKKRYFKNQIDEKMGIARKTQWEEISIEKNKEMSEKYLVMFLMMNSWVEIKQQGKCLANYFEQHSFFSIAIYGMGYVGERLLMELRDSNIRVEYGIDQRADSVYTDLVTITPDDNLEAVDVIVVTSVFYFDGIKKMLEQKIDCPIISLESILNEMQYSF